VGWLEESIIRMYQAGMSTREVGQFVERILGHHYSPQTISRITDSVLDDIQQWQQRPLRKRYSVIYLDALFRKIRRQKVATEAIYLALGVNEEGNREILGFYVGGSEAAYGWLEVLQALKERGVEEVLLGVFDGLPSLDESFQQVFPKADVQRCVVHKVRNTLRKIRKKDQPEFA
jgi:transposase-like protein